MFLTSRKRSAGLGAVASNTEGSLFGGINAIGWGANKSAAALGEDRVDWREAERMKRTFEAGSWIGSRPESNGPIRRAERGRGRLKKRLAAGEYWAEQGKIV